MINTVKRLQRELDEITKKPVPNCAAGPRSDSDMVHWLACLTGPDGSPYAGGNFVLEIDFDNEYPFKPPKVKFVTKIYHPNINQSGNVCLDLLKDKWEPSRTVSDVLLGVSSLLLAPNPDDPLVPEIAHLYKENRADYEAMARDWTTKYASDKP